MSKYLVDQLRCKPNITVALQSEVRAVYGDKARLSVASDASGFQVSFMIPRRVEDFDDP